MKLLLKRVLQGFEPRITQWDEPTIRFRVDGTQVIGRPTRGFGDGGTFSYAGKDYSPEPWTDSIREIKEVSEKIAGQELERDVKFTFCLAGLYATGNDGIPHHSDTVPTGRDIVFSISFGAPRTFHWIEYEQDIKEHSNTSDVVTDGIGVSGQYTYLMEDGDAMLFDGESQMNSTHAVPSVIGVGERINLTFRTGL